MDVTFFSGNILYLFGMVLVLDTHIINEGKVKIEVPDFDKVSSDAPVFYNPVMELNRDISVVVINQYRKDVDHDIRICDAFGGTGIRGARYSMEVVGVDEVVVGDVNPLAVRQARNNMELNKITNVSVEKNDANILLHSNKGLFDVVDLDPFGTPSMFLQSASANIRSGGLLCVSATDTSALCGTYHDPCIRKYGAVPQKTEYCHENGVRILIASISRNLAVNQKYLHVLFCHSTEHYMRVYATVGKGSKRANEALENIGFIAHCPDCLYRQTFMGVAPSVAGVCPECGAEVSIAGPLWLGDIWDKDFIERAMETAVELDLNKKDELLDLFGKCLNECDGPVSFYDIHKVCKTLKVSSPKFNDVIDAIRSRGYFASRTHFKPTGIRTDMPLYEFKRLILKLLKI